MTSSVKRVSGPSQLTVFAPTPRVPSLSTWTLESLKRQLEPALHRPRPGPADFAQRARRQTLHDFWVKRHTEDMYSYSHQKNHHHQRRNHSWPAPPDQTSGLRGLREMPAPGSSELHLHWPCKGAGLALADDQVLARQQQGPDEQQGQGAPRGLWKQPTGGSAQTPARQQAS